MERVVNGRTLSPLWAWRYGRYLISTDSPEAAVSGEGEFTVARGDWDNRVAVLTWIGTEGTLSGAATLADYDQVHRDE